MSGPPVRARSAGAPGATPLPLPSEAVDLQALISPSVLTASFPALYMNQTHELQLIQMTDFIECVLSVPTGPSLGRFNLRIIHLNDNFGHPNTCKA